MIYDLWTTQFNPATGAVTRTPFAGNVIPRNRIDPTARRVLQDLACADIDGRRSCWALDNTSQAQFVSPLDLRSNFYSLYGQDDIRLTRNITLNLGLRYELETGLRDAENRLSRFLDLSSPIPEMQANPPAIPESVTRFNNVPYQFNGAWNFTDDQNPNAYKTPRNRFMPRAGIAIRLNDKTALRIGYARYVI